MGVLDLEYVYFLFESPPPESSGDNSPCLITMNKFFHTGTLVAHHLSQWSALSQTESSVA